MKNKHYECSNCDAVYRLGHDLDTDYYKVEFCPFCGDPIDAEENFDVEDDYND